MWLTARPAQHIKGHCGRFMEMLSLRVSPPSSRALLPVW